MVAVVAVAAAFFAFGASSEAKRAQAPGTLLPEAAGAVTTFHVVSNLDRLYAEVFDRMVHDYLDGVYAEQLQEQARQRAAARAVAPPQIRTSNGSGPHSDAWWWGVAICEQGGRNDPYFGYFSWMDGSAAGLTWDEQVAKSNALLSRVSSESPAWAPSCVAAGYAASPSG